VVFVVDDDIDVLCWIIQLAMSNRTPCPKLRDWRGTASVIHAGSKPSPPVEWAGSSDRSPLFSLLRHKRPCQHSRELPVALSILTLISHHKFRCRPYQPDHSRNGCSAIEATARNQQVIEVKTGQYQTPEMVCTATLQQLSGLRPTAVEKRISILVR